MQYAHCEVCGRAIARERGGLRAHKTTTPAHEAWRARRTVYLRKADHEAAASATWCIGGAQQLTLPGFAS
jgi:hypothetical protein